MRSYYTSCVFCKKRKHCIDSVQPHRFTSSCFESEYKIIKNSVDSCKKYAGTSFENVFDEVLYSAHKFENNLIDILTGKNYKIMLLSRYIARDNCERVCVNAGQPPCTEKDDCDSCTHKCKCQTCNDFSNLEIDWEKIEKSVVKENHKNVI